MTRQEGNKTAHSPDIIFLYSDGVRESERTRGETADQFDRWNQVGSKSGRPSSFVAVAPNQKLSLSNFKFNGLCRVVPSVISPAGGFQLQDFKARKDYWDFVLQTNRPGRYP